MKLKTRIISAVLIGAMFTNTGFAALNFGSSTAPIQYKNAFDPANRSSSSDLGSVLQKIAGSEDFKSVQTLRGLSGAIMAVGDFFSQVNQWLDENGIHVVPLTKKLGSLLLLFLEKFVDLLRFGIGKL